MRMLVLPREVQKNEVTPVACRRCRSLLSFSSRLRFSSVSPLLGATTSCFFPIVFTSTPHSCDCDRPGRVEGKTVIQWEMGRFVEGGSSTQAGCDILYTALQL